MISFGFFVLSITNFISSIIGIKVFYYNVKSKIVTNLLPFTEINHSGLTVRIVKIG